jgi:TetR/AcrR family transcriptional repressor of nem operon
LGHSQVDKAASRERILAEASGQIRREGLESLSVGKLMGKAGLTHGGFYGHFPSREALLAEALARALADGSGDARRAAARQDRPAGLAGFVRSYLSRAHRDAPEAGCAIAALVCDAGRASEPCRAAMEDQVEGMIDSLQRQLGGADEAEAMAAVATLVGALALSRVFTDEKRSDAMLRAAREQVTAMRTSET